MDARAGHSTDTRSGWARRISIGVVAIVTAAGLLGAGGTAGAEVPVQLNGVGSPTAGLALQQWTADLQSSGAAVNYTPTSSPDGLARYAGRQVDFALSELEYPSYPPTLEPDRGYQFLPAFGNALAVTFNVADGAGRAVDQLHLPPRVIAQIFLGDIERWSDPAIATANPRTDLPDEPITVAYPNGEAGTTAFFFDFVAASAPDLFGPWATAHGFSTEHRITDVGVDPTFVPRSLGINGQDGIAQHVASDAGRWTIGYVPFAYAAAYGTDVASTSNASGAAVHPSATSTTAALRGATWHADTTIDLAGVYASPDPAAYPISSVTYLVTPCEPAAGFPTCAQGFDDPARAAALAVLVRYAACDGQATMAALGLAPLPENLSQDAVDGIARLIGSDDPPETLTSATCTNPAFVDPPPTTTTTTTTTTPTPTTVGGAADGPPAPATPTPPATPVVVEPTLAG